METGIKELIERIKTVTLASVFRDHHSPLIIYGAGNFGRDVFTAAVRRGFTISCFLDRTAELGDHWQGVPILQPSDQRIPDEERRRVTVLVAIHNRDVELSPVVQTLKAEGYPHVITPVEFYDFLGDELGERYWLTSRSFYQRYVEDISEGFAIWADEHSREIYREIISYRVTGQYGIPPLPDVDRQYVPVDVPPFRTPLRFVDCGAFDGDSIRRYLELGIDVEAVAAFEPDPDNFKKLSGFIGEQSRGNAFPEVMLWPCGVFKSTQCISFLTCRGESAKIAPEGKMMIQCVSLDEAIPDFRPNLIKMDIEGAEYDALLGAKKLIQRNMPVLAICVYHHPADLWRIPLLINQWACGYEFYLRLHAYNGFDLVMYAVQR